MVSVDGIVGKPTQKDAGKGMVARRATASIVTIGTGGTEVETKDVFQGSFGGTKSKDGSKSIQIRDNGCENQASERQPTYLNRNRLVNSNPLHGNLHSQ
jgi:hypothetical protein